MPRPVKGTPEQREKFMFETFLKHYSDPSNTEDLSVNKANDLFRKKFGSMLRNKRTYQIRTSAKTQARGGSKSATVAAARNPKVLTTKPGGPGAACLVTGNQEQIAWLREQVLPQLQQAGLATARIDHANETYAVLAR